MTWTPITVPSTTWQGKLEGIFSPVIFSLATYNGKEVFAIGTSSLVWSNKTAPTPNWSPVA